MRRSRISVRPNVARPGGKGLPGSQGGQDGQGAAAADTTLATETEGKQPDSAAVTEPGQPAGQSAETAAVLNASQDTSAEKHPPNVGEEAQNGGAPNDGPPAASTLQRRKRFSAMPNLAKPRAAAPARTPIPPVPKPVVPPTPTEPPATASRTPVPLVSKPDAQPTPTEPPAPASRTPVPPVPKPDAPPTPTDPPAPTPEAQAAGQGVSEQGLGSPGVAVFGDQDVSQDRTEPVSPVAPSTSCSEPVKKKRVRKSSDRPSKSPESKPSCSQPDQSELSCGKLSPGNASPQAGPSMQHEPLKLRGSLEDRQRIAKARKLKQMLRAENRKERSQKKSKHHDYDYSMPPDHSKMTMGDLIHYLPETNPMKSAVIEEEKEQDEKFIPQSPSNGLPQSKQEVDEEQEEEEEEVDDEEMLVPKVKVAEDGTLIIDEESLTVRVMRAKGPTIVEGNDPIFERGSTTTYTSFRNLSYTKPWSDKETDMFFLAISMVGSDFSMICQLFPHRNRKEVKNKFKREEKINSWRIDKAFREKRPFDMQFFNMLLGLVLDADKKKKNKPKPKPKPKRSPGDKPKPKRKGKKASAKGAKAEQACDDDEELDGDVGEGDFEKENEDCSNVAKAEDKGTKKRQKRVKKSEGEEEEEEEEEDLTKKPDGVKKKRQKKMANGKKNSANDVVLDGDVAEGDLETAEKEKEDCSNTGEAKDANKDTKKRRKRVKKGEEEEQEAEEADPTEKQEDGAKKKRRKKIPNGKKASIEGADDEPPAPDAATDDLGRSEEKNDDCSNTAKATRRKRKRTMKAEEEEEQEEEEPDSSGKKADGKRRKRSKKDPDADRVDVDVPEADVENGQLDAEEAKGSETMGSTAEGKPDKPARNARAKAKPNLERGRQTKSIPDTEEETIDSSRREEEETFDSSRREEETFDSSRREEEEEKETIDSSRREEEETIDSSRREEEEEETINSSRREEEEEETIDSSRREEVEDQEDGDFLPEISDSGAIPEGKSVIDGSAAPPFEEDSPEADQQGALGVSATEGQELIKNTRKRVEGQESPRSSLPPPEPASPAKVVQPEMRPWPSVGVCQESQPSSELRMGEHRDEGRWEPELEEVEEEEEEWASPAHTEEEDEEQVLLPLGLRSLELLSNELEFLAGVPEAPGTGPSADSLCSEPGCEGAVEQGVNLNLLLDDVMESLSPHFVAGTHTEENDDEVARTLLTLGDPDLHFLSAAAPIPEIASAPDPPSQPPAEEQKPESEQADQLQRSSDPPQNVTSDLPVALAPINEAETHPMEEPGRPEESEGATGTRNVAQDSETPHSDPLVLSSVPQGRRIRFPKPRPNLGQASRASCTPLRQTPAPPSPGTVTCAVDPAPSTSTEVKRGQISDEESASVSNQGEASGSEELWKPGAFSSQSETPCWHSSVQTSTPSGRRSRLPKPRPNLGPMIRAPRPTLSQTPAPPEPDDDYSHSLPEASGTATPVQKAPTCRNTDRSVQVFYQKALTEAPTEQQTTETDGTAVVEAGAGHSSFGTPEASSQPYPGPSFTDLAPGTGGEGTVCETPANTGVPQGPTLNQNEAVRKDKVHEDEGASLSADTSGPAAGIEATSICDVADTSAFVTSECMEGLSWADVGEEEPTFILTLFEIPLPESGEYQNGPEVLDPARENPVSSMVVDPQSLPPPAAPEPQNCEEAEESGSGSVSHLVLSNALIPVCEEQEEGPAQHWTGLQEQHPLSEPSHTAGEMVPESHDQAAESHDQAAESHDQVQSGTDEASERDTPSQQKSKLPARTRRGKVQVKPCVTLKKLRGPAHTQPGPAHTSPEPRPPTAPHPDSQQEEPTAASELLQGIVGRSDLPQEEGGVAKEEGSGGGEETPLAYHSTQDSCESLSVGVSEAGSGCGSVTHLVLSHALIPVCEEQEEGPAQDWTGLQEQHPLSEPSHTAGEMVPESHDQEAESHDPVHAGTDGASERDTPSQEKSKLPARTRRGKLQVKPCVTLTKLRGPAHTQPGPAHTSPEPRPPTAPHPDSQQEEPTAASELLQRIVGHSDLPQEEGVVAKEESSGGGEETPLAYHSTQDSCESLSMGVVEAGSGCGSVTHLVLSDALIPVCEEQEEGPAQHWTGLQEQRPLSEPSHTAGEMVPQSHDQAVESHDQAATSHDLATESHDLVTDGASERDTPSQEKSKLPARTRRGKLQVKPCVTLRKLRGPAHTQPGPAHTCPQPRPPTVPHPDSQQEEPAAASELLQGIVGHSDLPPEEGGVAKEESSGGGEETPLAYHSTQDSCESLSMGAEESGCGSVTHLVLSHALIPVCEEHEEGPAQHWTGLQEQRPLSEPSHTAGEMVPESHDPAAESLDPVHARTDGASERDTPSQEKSKLPARTRRGKLQMKPCVTLRKLRGPAHTSPEPRPPTAPHPDSQQEEPTAASEPLQGIVGHSDLPPEEGGVAKEESSGGGEETPLAYHSTQDSCESLSMGAEESGCGSVTHLVLSHALIPVCEEQEEGPAQHWTGLQEQRPLSEPSHTAGEMVPESHDQAAESHDQAAKSHDLAAKSHDLATESHDLVTDGASERDTPSQEKSKLPARTRRGKLQVKPCVTLRKLRGPAHTQPGPAHTSPEPRPPTAPHPDSQQEEPTAAPELLQGIVGRSDLPQEEGGVAKEESSGGGEETPLAYRSTQDSCESLSMGAEESGCGSVTHLVLSHALIPVCEEQEEGPAQHWTGLQEQRPLSEPSHTAGEMVPESHDQAAESHDQAAESHDQAAKSHDLAAKSHDLATESHDLATESHDLVTDGASERDTPSQEKSKLPARTRRGKLQVKPCVTLRKLRGPAHTQPGPAHTSPEPRPPTAPHPDSQQEEPTAAPELLQGIVGRSDLPQEEGGVAKEESSGGGEETPLAYHSTQDSCESLSMGAEESGCGSVTHLVLSHALMPVCEEQEEGPGQHWTGLQEQRPLSEPSHTAGAMVPESHDPAATSHDQAAESHDPVTDGASERDTPSQEKNKLPARTRRGKLQVKPCVTLRKLRGPAHTQPGPTHTSPEPRPPTAPHPDSQQEEPTAASELLQGIVGHSDLPQEKGGMAKEESSGGGEETPLAYRSTQDSCESLSVGAEESGCGSVSHLVLSDALIPVCEEQEEGPAQHWTGLQEQRPLSEPSHTAGEMVPESHDQAAESHDQAAESHDQAATSHDQAATSHDQAAESLDPVTDGASERDTLSQQKSKLPARTSGGKLQVKPCVTLRKLRGPAHTQPGPAHTSPEPRPPTAPHPDSQQEEPTAASELLQGIVGHSDLPQEEGGVAKEESNGGGEETPLAYHSTQDSCESLSVGVLEAGSGCGSVTHLVLSHALIPVCEEQEEGPAQHWTGLQEQHPLSEPSHTAEEMVPESLDQAAESHDPVHAGTDGASERDTPSQEKSKLPARTRRGKLQVKPCVTLRKLRAPAHTQPGPAHTSPEPRPPTAPHPDSQQEEPTAASELLHGIVGHSDFPQEEGDVAKEESSGGGEETPLAYHSTRDSCESLSVGAEESGCDSVTHLVLSHALIPVCEEQEEGPAQHWTSLQEQHPLSEPSHTAGETAVDAEEDHSSQIADLAAESLDQPGMDRASERDTPSQEKSKLPARTSRGKLQLKPCVTLRKLSVREELDLSEAEQPGPAHTQPGPAHTQPGPAHMSPPTAPHPDAQQEEPPVGELPQGFVGCSVLPQEEGGIAAGAEEESSDGGEEPLLPYHSTPQSTSSTLTRSGRAPRGFLSFLSGDGGAGHASRAARPISHKPLVNTSRTGRKRVTGDTVVTETSVHDPPDTSPPTDVRASTSLSQPSPESANPQVSAPAEGEFLCARPSEAEEEPTKVSEFYFQDIFTEVQESD
ncbi:mucin-12 isoform X3 [Conger conger]|uniref:mucin-12 isoform X3 n=1 Tax=Conger conger TaxID=82655 RepID=UPI002A59B00F|nr:mucin-12 isoform X3 [Conger conger]